MFCFFFSWHVLLSRQKKCKIWRFCLSISYRPCNSNLSQPTQVVKLSLPLTRQLGYKQTSVKMLSPEKNFFLLIFSWQITALKYCSINKISSYFSLFPTKRCWSFRVQLKCDGTRWHTGVETKGNLTNGVGSQYSSHYLGTWCIQHYYRWCAHLSCQ